MNVNMTVTKLMAIGALVAGAVMGIIDLLELLDLAQWIDAWTKIFWTVLLGAWAVSTPPANSLAV